MNRHHKPYNAQLESMEKGQNISKKRYAKGIAAGPLKPASSFCFS
jgi:hypothetical protein